MINEFYIDIVVYIPPLMNCPRSVIKLQKIQYLIQEPEENNTTREEF